VVQEDQLEEAVVARQMGLIQFLVDQHLQEAVQEADTTAQAQVQETVILEALEVAEDGTQVLVAQVTLL
jgi:hypothetical protein